MRFRCLPALFLCLALPVPAQTFTTKNIVFKNPGPFTPAQLQQASALEPGVTVTAADLTAAAQKLMDTGYFDDISASVEGELKAATAIFALKPLSPAQLLPAGFENFVWLTPAEIHQAIVRQVPLFNETLAETSTQADSIDTALRTALAAKGIDAIVEHEVVEPTLEHPSRVFEFRVLTPAVRVANIKLSGVSATLVPLVQKSVNATARTPLNLGLAGTLTTQRILAPLLDAGYLRASLLNLNATAATESEGAFPVVISGALQAGEIYRVSSLSFAGTPLVSTESFAKTQTLHPGDVASRQELLKTLAPLDVAYRKQGYMDVVIKASPQIDEAAHQVAYAISVNPGEPYRVHELTVNGLDGSPRADFDRNFQVKAGQLYDPIYVAGFLKNNSALRSLTGVSGSYRAVAYPITRTVDLTIQFVHLAGQ